MIGLDRVTVRLDVDDFTAFVVANLKGIKGKDAGEVVNYILREWIGEHLSELAAYAITVKKWEEQ